MRFTGYVAALALPLLAVATTTVTVTPGPSPTPLPASRCNTGPIQCCSSLQSASSPNALNVLALLDIVLEGASLPVGLTCFPILGSNSCAGTPVCCEDNSHGNLISIGCVPVILNV